MENCLTIRSAGVFSGCVTCTLFLKIESCPNANTLRSFLVAQHNKRQLEKISQGLEDHRASLGTGTYRSSPLQVAITAEIARLSSWPDAIVGRIRVFSETALAI